MHGGIHYFPISTTALYLLASILLAVAILIGVGILRYTYESIGIDHRYMLSLLVLSLLGSFINIPVAELPDQQVVTHTIIEFGGIGYVVPSVVGHPGTIIAANLGGAVIPTAISLYLLWKNRLWEKGALAVAAVALVTYWLAVPVRGIGIAVPFFIPPLVAGLVAFLISRQRAAPLAYTAGSLGTLIGADLLNLGKINGLGAPVASIGGAGTFDGIFLSSVFAVLLTGLLGRFHRRNSCQPHE